MKRLTCGCISLLIVLALALAGLLTWASDNNVSLRPVVIAGLVGVGAVWLLTGRALWRLLTGPVYTPAAPSHNFRITRTTRASIEVITANRPRGWRQLPPGVSDYSTSRVLGGWHTVFALDGSVPAERITAALADWVD